MKSWRARLFHSIDNKDTPRRIAAAFAIGVFLSFSPFLGLQIATGMTIALALRLNRIAMFAGLCTNLPWIMVPWYTITTAAAAPLFGTPITGLGGALTTLLDLPFYRPAFWTQAAALLSPYIWAFLVGATCGAAILGGLAYLGVLRVLIASRSATA